jgi:hypothetical protein
MWTNQLIEPALIMSSLLAIFILGLIGISIARSYKRAKYIKLFTDYRGVLEYHMEKAYDMVHRENILPYSLEAFRVKDEDYDKISQDFVRLVQKFIGPMMLSEFIYLYGDENTFIFNLLEYFSTRYENDEIRNTALEQITESEGLSQEAQIT